ncbi:MAG: hypothetical protein GY747_12785 [Planctomycetes bacterium]|nr:hypothetical protein [Planctomycetota bacterium]MCP4770553.1 hypothetical protein [Planctomycetota bacterium]MCP4860356.1 hypothetical protein [Planctomycetota bacterium]
MKKVLSILFPVLALSFAGSATAQTGTLDQSELHTNVAWNMGYFNDMQQDIQVGVAGALEGFKIRMASQNVANGLPVAIFDGPGPHPVGTTPDWQGTAYVTSTLGWEWVWVDCSSANLVFDVYDIFTIRVGDGVNYTSSVDLTGNQGWPNTYYLPPFYEHQNLETLTRLTFETYMVPPTLTLAISGTCGGMMTLTATHGSGSYWVVYGDAGNTTVRGVDLLIANPQIATTMANTFTAYVPASVCGKTVQIVDQLDHSVSNPVIL